MAVPQAVISYDLSEMDGSDLLPGWTFIRAFTNIPSQEIIDTSSGAQLLGDAEAKVPDDGAGSISVPRPGGTSNPSSWQTSFQVRYRLASNPGVEAVRTYGPFTLSGDNTLGSLVDEQEIPPDFGGAAFIAQVEAIRDEQEEIAGLTGEDAAIANRINTPGSDTDDALKAGYVVEGSAYADLGKQPGVDNTGTTECSAALQTALDGFAALGVRAYAKGTFRTNSLLTIASNADLSDATINYEGSGNAILVGTTTAGTYVWNLDVRLPRVIATAKTVAGWAQVANTVGVKVSNLYSSRVEVPLVRNFETGLQLQGLGHGTSYVTLVVGHLDNNKRNLRFTADATGWANQNTIVGGRLSHNSAEGTVVSGTRHVLMETTPNKVNNNNFYGTSLESPNVVEYHIDCGGTENFWWGCRFENTGTGARVLWKAGSADNVIARGVQSHNIVETAEDTGSARNEVWQRITTRHSGGSTTTPVFEMMNRSGSSAPLIYGYEAGTSLPDTSLAAWSLSLSSQALKGKRKADTEARVNVDFVNGRVYFGDGSAAATVFIGASGAIIRMDSTTQTTAPAAGGAGALPATPAGYMQVVINGTTCRIPYY